MHLITQSYEAVSKNKRPSSGLLCKCAWWWMLATCAWYLCEGFKPRISSNNAGESAVCWKDYTHLKLLYKYVNILIYIIGIIMWSYPQLSLRRGKDRATLPSPYTFIYQHKLCHWRTRALRRITKTPSQRRAFMRRHNQDAAICLTGTFLFCFIAKIYS